MTARAVMVLGTTSGAGKSWLTTALCRWYSRQGFRTAPFKAQNMSNNARIAQGLNGEPGEIGSAQYFQALAARREPDVRMNPVLLKPERDTASQIIVMGKVRDELRQIPWRERSAHLWPQARQALHQLMADNDIVVIEGAGSPAEINLHDSDYVNMRTALEVSARCLIVTDIDRGGAFAHLYGTYQLLQPCEQALIAGFVLNRFRGDASLLAPGPAQLEALTGVPTVAVLPMWREHGLPEEDGLFDGFHPGQTQTRGQQARAIAIVAYPHISNLDEFQPLRQADSVHLSWVRDAQSIAQADWIILPGSKDTVADLAWLKASGLDSAIMQHVDAGKPLLGICGGLQILGRAIGDPSSNDTAAAGDALGLLPFSTAFSEFKKLRQADLGFGTTTDCWSTLSAVQWRGYEIHHGHHEPHDETLGRHAVLYNNTHGEPCGWQSGNTLGIYAHGLFESPEVMQALFGHAHQSLDSVFDGLADYIEQHFESALLQSLVCDGATGIQSHHLLR